MKFAENLSPNGNKGKAPATEFDDELDPRGKTGKRLTILSIDGGGVRGIIPAIILEALEIYLAKEEKEQVKAGESNETTHHLYEYFDMIAGTSSGGLITAMITTRSPNDSPEPCFNATKVVEFFEENAVKIFPKKFTDKGRISVVLEAIASLGGPLYTGDELKALLEKKFGQALLSNALTSVIIPAFDTENEVPVFFSNLKGVDSAKPLYDVQVKDACWATTAAPIFFPAANFKENQNQSGRPIREFNVIDGGIAVNDPTLLAVAQEIAEEQSREGLEMDSLDFNNVLVLSLGTGQHPIRFVAKPHWSSVHWLGNPSGLPLLSSFFSASGDMVEYFTSMIFDAHQSGHHYLRIQTDCLPTSVFWEIDDATPPNLKKLKEIADDILDGPVSKRNFATGKLDAIPGGGKNKEALRRFARWLVEERREREQKQPTVDDSSKGERSRTGGLRGQSGPRRRRSPCYEKGGPDETLTDGTAPSTAGAVRTVVNGRCWLLRTVVGGCCWMMRTAILVFVRFVVFIFGLCMGLCGF